MKIELLKQLRQEAKKHRPEHEERWYDDERDGSRTWYTFYWIRDPNNGKKYGAHWLDPAYWRPYVNQRRRIRREWILSEVQRLRNNPLDLYNIEEEIP